MITNYELRPLIKAFAILQSYNAIKYQELNFQHEIEYVYNWIVLFKSLRSDGWSNENCLITHGGISLNYITINFNESKNYIVYNFLSFKVIIING